MEVKLVFPPSGVQAKVRAVDTDGNEVQLAYVVITPHFFRSDEKPAVLYATASYAGSKGECVTDRVVATVAGRNGRLSLQHCVTPVLPEVATEEVPEAISPLVRPPGKVVPPDEIPAPLPIRGSK